MNQAILKVNSQLEINTVLIPKIQNLLNDNSEEILCLKIVGMSMFPVLDDGDKIFIKSINFDDLKIGDFVTFRRNDQLVTHRIIRIFANRIITKGDNLILPDEEIVLSQIIGKVIQIDKRQKLVDLQQNYWKRINHLLGYIHQLSSKQYLTNENNSLRNSTFYNYIAQTFHYILQGIERILIYGK